MNKTYCSNACSEFFKAEKKEPTPMEKILDAVREIQKYQGEAYQIFDEIGLAVHTIEVEASRAIYEGK